jgi:hypothetical protein
MKPREIDIEDTMIRNRKSREEILFALEAAEMSGKAFSRVDPITKTKKYFWLVDDGDE